jgi:agmatinase
MESFDPNGPGIPGKLFGLPFTPANASLIIVPVPWEVTVSYKAGTANGPDAVRAASSQVDLFLRDIPDAWKLGVAMLPIPQTFLEENRKLREMAAQLIDRAERGERADPHDPLLLKINEACESLNIYVKSTALKQMAEGRIVGLLGGDHSTPLGFLRALAEHYNHFGILHLDAHADLRKAYEGFTNSHASIMYNALRIPAVNKLVQVGIRDLCAEEMDLIRNNTGRIATFFDDDLKAQLFQGTTWDNLCNQIVRELPQNVYISFDIDALDPKLCPSTGTPVPGGLQFEEAIYLLKKVARAGKKIIGFDLVEVAPSPHHDWDANVGARLLYQLSALTITTHKNQ